VKAQYTSPSGSVHTFLWESLKKETELKTGVFTFPDVDGAKVQHNGSGVRTLPFTCIFNGKDCTTQADAFEEALIERGSGTLQHPLYGTLSVVPNGTIKRSDDLVEVFGESIVEVSFIETIIDEAPFAEAVVSEDFDEFAENLASDFAENITAETAQEQLSLKTKLIKSINAISESLESIVEGTEKLTEFLTLKNELTNSIGNLFNSVENVASGLLNVGRQTLRLLRMPSKIAVNVNEKIKGYSSLVSVLLNDFKRDPVGANNIKNSFYSSKLLLEGSASSVAMGIGEIVETSDVNIQLKSRDESVKSVLSIAELFDQIKTFQDTKLKKNVFEDTSVSMAQLNTLIYSNISLLLNAGFSLPSKKTIVLNRDYQLLELIAELYPLLTDSVIDDFIAENNINYDEMLIVLRGREVVSYV
ncbi:MAG: DNA circularization N-terminal domain-containing protein, partial [Treponemataceae bacterium]